MSPRELKDVALVWHSWGYPVVSVIFKPKANGQGWDKIPLVEYAHWKDRAAMQTAEDVEAMPWDRAEGVAILLWPASDRIVIDEDGDGAGGLVEEAGYALPATGIMHTRSGGRHRHYLVPPGTPPPDPKAADRHKRAIRLFHAKDANGKPCKPAVDLLFNGIVVVAGPGYREDPDHPVEPGRQAFIPQAMLDLGRARDRAEGQGGKGPDAAQSEYAELLQGVPHGVQHDTSVKLIGHMLHKLPLAEVWAIMDGWCDRCTPPADKAKVRANFEDILQKERARTAERRNRAPLVRAVEIRAEPLAYCVDEILPREMLTLLSGKDKRGKTLLALEIVKAYLLEESFLGVFPVKGGGPVACYLLDDPDALTVDRLKRLGIYENPNLFLATASKVDLSDPRGAIEDMTAEVKRIGARLTVTDALYLFVPPGREAGNDGARMGPVMRAFNAMVEAARTTQLVICHDNKAGVDVAGSHVIRAAAKAILRLELPKRAAEDEEDGPQTPQRVLRIETKMGPAQSYALEILGTRDEYRGWRYHGTAQQANAADTRTAVKTFLDRGGSGTVEEIAEGVKRRREDVEKALTGMTEAKPPEAMAEPRRGKRGRPATIYRAPDFPSRDDSPSPARDGNSTAQPVEIALIPGRDYFPSRSTAPKETGRDGNSEPLEEVAL